MFRRMKREMCVVSSSLPLLILSAFLCALFGTILWVSGGSTNYLLRNGILGAYSITVGAVFSVWLITYGLVGISLGMIWLACKCRLILLKACLTAFALCMLLYLLMESWYAVFFCTRLVLFSAIILFLSILICAVVIIITRKSFRLLTFTLIIIELVQIYFLCFTFRELC